MTPKYASIDFEFYDTAENTLEIVCASIRYDGKTINFWTHKGEETPLLLDHIQMLKSSGYIMLAYAVTAEASSFISLGLDPLDFKWVDLYLEYRCLSNHNDNYAYGKQLIQGRKKFTKRPLPKWQRKTEADEKKADASKQEYGMGAAVYKTLGKVIDTDFKKEIRDIIIACNDGTKESIDAMVERKEEIMTYCASDVEYLEPMWKEFINEYKRLLGVYFDGNAFRQHVYARSEYACRTAIMERLGYPIRVEETRNFSDQVGNIIWECQTDINEQFKSNDERLFRSKTLSRPLDLTWNQGFTRVLVSKWCYDNNKRWVKTDGGDNSLSLKAFSKHISYRHNYPRGNFLAQMQRYLKLKQGLNGFTPNTAKSKKKKFWDSVGGDGRVRPYMGIYGAQSSRSQPSATGFIPLKASWMRALIAPKKGMSMCGIDWSSQEFLVSALLSGDNKMLNAYESGDVYLSFAKDCNVVPQDATKASHGKQRDFMKPIILGQQYDLTKYGLATQLTESTGIEHTPDMAQVWIDKHKKTYKTLWRWKAKIQKEYKLRKFVKLPDGWFLWGDNDNFRSVGNFPTQGFSACIMRKSVQLAQDAGLRVTYTLHDAIYIEFDPITENYHPQMLAECMDAGFRFYFPSELQDKATCRMEADIWGPEYSQVKEYLISYRTSNGIEMEMTTKEQSIYIDPRGKEEYEKFKKYFEEADFDNYEF